MKPFTMQSALAASVILITANLPAVRAQQAILKGCYSDSKPLLDQGPYTYQSNGYCQKLCLKDSHTVFALTKGTNCLCGDQLPADSAKTDDGSCNTKCAGWPEVMCGGSNAFSVYLTGLVDSVDSYSSSTSSSSSSSSASSTETGTSTISNNGHIMTTAGGQTVFMTADSQATTQATDGQKKKDSGSNTAAIAAGVVVGIVGFFALVGAIFFLWRFRNRSNMPDQYRHNDIDNFGAKPMSQSSMSDSRFDGDFMAQRRQSNGSIDDDQDFSRRILQVTNPDRR
ncbi:WSC domain-containing protein [Aspergillus coremiiformis]|uniref:WSC domain-containing protein n=1 Tax=Aspergillus coremiiformis TaxID=138285 RepID=A0A5N6YUL9_9EURO|nr:WSC domain-containing protein [Aspergillus coremiiformis]